MTSYPSTADVQAMSAAQLVAAHNRYGSTEVKRFSSRLDGIKQVQKLIEGLRIAEAGRVPVFAEEVEAKIEPAKPVAAKSAKTGAESIRAATRTTSP